MRKDDWKQRIFREQVMPLVLILVVLILASSACGRKEGAETGDGNVQNSENSEAKSGDTEADGDDADDANGEAASSRDETESTVYVIKNQEIVSNEDVTFVVNSVSQESDWGHAIEVTCENHTDESLMFSWDDVSVNGYMIDPVWACEVAGGKKAKGTITFAEADLKKCGVNALDNVSFDLRVSSSDDWSADAVYEETCQIWPTGVDEKSWKVSEREAADGEQVVSETDDYIFVVLGAGEDSDWGYYGVDCYFENRTDETMMYTWGDVSVNGTMVDPFWAETVAPGKRAYATICFYDSDLEDAGIDQVKEIEYRLQIYDYDETDGDYRCDEVFSYKPEEKAE